jgi:biopolymer transport protein ExbB
MKVRAILSSLALGMLALTAAPSHAQDASGGGIAPKVEFVDSLAAHAPQQPHDLSPWGMYQGADGVVKAVILILILASIVTWTVCLGKALEFIAERGRLKQGLMAIHLASDLTELKDVKCQAIVDMVMNAEDEMAASLRLSDQMPSEGVKERVAIRLERVEAGAIRRLGRTIGLLAIIGSTAPFVGLFGTVWGVMKSFIGIADAKTTNLSVVAPGIAEALLATAFGLIAAIPAVVVYNLCSRVISGFRGELGDASVAVSCFAGRAIDQSATRGH